MANLLAYKEIPKAQRVLCYGAPKSGKTCQLGGLAKQFKILYLDLEDSVDSLFLVCNDEQLANIEYIRVCDTPSNPAAVSTLLRMFEDRKGYICSEHSAWKCPRCVAKQEEFFHIDLDELTPDKWIIAIDSGTQFALSALFHTCKANNIDLSSSDDKATFAMWRAQGAYIDKLFSTFQVLANNIYITAHEIEVTMPDKSVKLVPSIGTRNYAASVGKYFGHVIRLSRSSAGHKGASLTATVGAEAGSRWGIDYSKASMPDFYIRPSNLHDNNPIGKVTSGGLTPKASPALGSQSNNLLNKLRK